MVGSVGANTTTYRDATVALDKTYTYRVWVTAEGSRAGSSNDASVVTASSPPAAPSQLNATPVGSTTILVLWTDNSANETGFRLERSENGGASWVTATTTPYAGFWDYERESDEKSAIARLHSNTVAIACIEHGVCRAAGRSDDLVGTTAPGLAIDLSGMTIRASKKLHHLAARGGLRYYYGLRVLQPIERRPERHHDRHANLDLAVQRVRGRCGKDGGERISPTLRVRQRAASNSPPTSGRRRLERTDRSARTGSTTRRTTTFRRGPMHGDGGDIGEGDFEPVTWVAGTSPLLRYPLQAEHDIHYRVVSCNIECSAPSNKATASSLP